MPVVANPNTHAVVIAGGGPTGLMLAAELALANVDVLIVERRADQELIGTRARGLHARTLEILDQRGVVERFLAAGYTAQVNGFAGVHFDISGFPSRHPYGLALTQQHTERLLAGWVAELGVPTLRGREVTGFAQDATGVDVALDDGTSLRAHYLVGCDGGRSVVRKAAGIGFPGTEATLSHLIGEVELAEEPAQWGMRNDAIGIHSLVQSPDGGPVQVMVSERQVGGEREPTLADLREALIAAYGTDFGVHSPHWLSRFSDVARQAERYRSGRVLLAGDAAHIHYPAGGQGLNTGVQDAVNLGWKLAQVVRGHAPDALLDSYHAERHPVAAAVLRNTLASVALSRPDAHARAARQVVAELLGFDEPRRQMAATMAGLDIHYDFGAGHPLLGLRMPDLDIVAGGMPVLIYELTHSAQPLLLNFALPGSLDIAPWADRVRLVDAAYDGVWELPAHGEVTAPSAVLVRPDGHVAWVGSGGDAGLADALTRWFGPAGD